MEVEQIAVPKKKAQEEFEEWKEMLRYAPIQLAKDMAKLYGHMRHGGKVIDIFEAMKLAGVNNEGDPKLAIVQADSKQVRFVKNSRWENGQNFANGGGVFCRQLNNRWREFKEDVRIPHEFFPSWAIENGQIVRVRIQTPTPIIPAKILNPLRSHKIENYHILWEVEKWNQVPKDPILLKRITPNMFLVLATWDLSPLEKAVIRGRA